MNPLDLLGPWKYAIYAAGALALFGSGVWSGHHFTSLSWQADMAAQERAANALYVDALNAKVSQERANADLAQKVDQDATILKAAADAGRDDFARKLRDARRRACDSGAGSGQAAGAGGGAEPAGSGDRGHGSADIDAGRRLRDYALDLQRYAKACHGWAMGVGR